MTSTTAMTGTARSLPTDKILVGIVFVLALATIAGAWGSQLFGGLVPCELCLAQRQAYYWGLPVLALILIFWNRLPLTVWYVAMLIAVGIFVWSAYMGAYHAGVEWKWWPGPASCTGGGAVNADQLHAFMSGAKLNVPQCDQAAWRMFGISMAGYNAVISLGLAVLSVLAVRQERDHG